MCQKRQLAAQPTAPKAPWHTGPRLVRAGKAEKTDTDTVDPA